MTHISHREKLSESLSLLIRKAIGVACWAILISQTAPVFGQCSAPSFVATDPFAVGTNPSAVALGDFNADGHKDIVVSNRLLARVAVLMGKADGIFGLPKFLNVEDGPDSMVIADFNGDGKQDLAVANKFGNSISILIGDGTGDFAPSKRFPAGNSPISLVAGDFNNDRVVDLAVANVNSGDISILLGRGDGQFNVAAPVPVGRNPSRIVEGDFNEDGRIDLAMLSDNTNIVSLLLGDGAGGFTLSQRSFTAGINPTSVVVGDLNNDRHQDLVIVNYGGNNVSVMLGDGSANFNQAVNFRVGQKPNNISLMDFNGDGKKDLAVTNFGDANLSLLLGRGDGNFERQIAVALGQRPVALVAEDFNLDGRPDLFTVNSASEVSITDNGKILFNTCNTPNLALRMRHSGGSSFTAGLNYSYMLTVSNRGDSQTIGPINITDPLPSGLEFISGAGAGWNCSARGRLITCNNAGPISIGGSSNLTLTVKVGHEAVPKITNSASVMSQGDLVLIDNAAEDTAVVNPSSDLSVQMDAPDTVTKGSNITYVVTLNNSGPSPAPEVILVDDLPASLQLVSATSSRGSCSGNTRIVCSIGDQAQDISVKIIVVARATEVGTVKNMVTVTGKNSDLDMSNNSKAVTTVVSQE